MAGSVVITGASSFVGVHLARCFAGAGWEVIATHSRAFEDYVGIQAERLRIAGAVARLVQLDLRDPDRLAAFVTAERPRLWVQHAGHATAYASMDYAFLESLTVNVAPLPPLYRALAASGCEGVLISGSSMEYSASGDANCEEDPCWPDTPYGLSKLAETLSARQQSRCYGLATRVARLYIPVGPLDNPAKLLPQVVLALKTACTMKLSPCRQRRDFVGVEDVARGYLAMAADLSRGGFDVFNLCSGEATPLAELLLGLAGRLGADSSLLEFGAIPMRPGEPEISFGRCDKARDRLGWKPAALTSVLDGLLEEAP